jgi:D-alanine--poly(phosphoribitol) ligase subunit 2
LQLSTPVTDSLVDEVHALVRTFSPKVGSAETDLVGSGILDSANLVRLLLAVETQFAVAIPLEDVDIDSIRSTASIAALVRERRFIEASWPLAKGAAAAGGEPSGVSASPASSGPLAAGPEGALERDGLIREIHELFMNSLLVEVASPDVDLFKAGILDSMLLVQLIMLLENQFDLSLSLEDFDVADFSTTAGIARLVRQSANGRK